MKKVMPMAAGIILCLGFSANVSANSFTDSISQECYENVKDAINKYYCEDYRADIVYIYRDYGTEEYSSYSATTSINRELQEIGLEFADIYGTYEDEANQELILFGYNFSLLAEMQYENSAMGTGIDHYKELEDYYNAFINDPSLQLCSDFRTYIDENKILNYVESIETTTDRELAKEAYEKMQIVTIKLKYCMNMITVDPKVAYDAFLDVADALLYVFDQQDTYSNLRGYIDYSTGKNIAGSRIALNASNKNFVEMLQYYKNGNDVMFEMCCQELLENFSYLLPVISNMYQNTEAIKNREGAAFDEKAIKVDLQKTALDKVEISEDDGQNENQEEDEAQEDIAEESNVSSESIQTYDNSTGSGVRYKWK